MRSTISLATFLAAGLTCAASAQTISESLKLTPADGGPDHLFGCCIALDQGLLAVGAQQDDDNGANSGSVYLYNSSTGALLLKLVPTDGAAGDRFGSAVAIADGLLAVGAPQDEHNGIASGSVYVFSAFTGAQVAKLTPDDAEAGDLFGSSVAIDAGVVAVGATGADDLGNASGAAYLFDASSGAQLDKLLPDQGAANQGFGVSVAIDAGVVAVGARTYFVLGDGFDFASVHLFDASTGAETGVLRADVENFNGDQGGQFGESIDIDNGLVAVGAWGRSVFFDHSGAAYVFDAETGDQLHFIFPADGHDRDHFGYSVSISNGVLAVGAEQDGDSGFVAGSAYLFDATSGDPIDKLLASDGAAFDYLGTSIAIENGLVAVGAIGDEDNGADSGSVYLFGEGASPCPADLAEPFGQLDFSDVVAFLAAFGSQDPAADFAEPFGSFDFSDVLGFLSVFASGCP